MAGNDARRQTPGNRVDLTVFKLQASLQRQAEVAAQSAIHHTRMSRHYTQLSHELTRLAGEVHSDNLAEIVAAAGRHAEDRVFDTAASPGSAPVPADGITAVDDRTGNTTAETDGVADAGPTGEMSPLTVAHDEAPTDLHVIDAPSEESSHGDSSASSRRKRKRRATDRWTTENLDEPAVQVKSVPRIEIDAENPTGSVPETPVEWIRHRWKSTALSTTAHIIALLLLGIFAFEIDAETPLNTVMAAFSEIVAEVEEEVPLEEPMEETGETEEEPVEEPPEEEPEPEPDPETPSEPVEAEQSEVEPEPVNADVLEPAADTILETDSTEIRDWSKVDSRSEDVREILLKKFGGTAASESAVHLALEWLKNHQRRDGSWNFNDIEQCSDPGDVDNAVGATSYALLVFLGAGQTHRRGTYKRQVKAGVEFIVRNGQIVPAGGDFRGPGHREHDGFYVHGAAAMVLCEALKMTRDRRLRQAAQAAINFIVNAQDPRGGGWRYEPQEPGCTSVTGLQLTALISAQKAKIEVPRRTLEGITHFLDGVQSDGGARYGYRAEEPDYRSSCTAIALLCRIYLGWDRDNESLIRGIALLDDKGPSSNLYYCYYATQVLRNWGGEEWERWNAFMREELIRTQSIDGPEKGSWDPRDRSITSKAGGRLFTTCLAALTLEVYYRYVPILEEPDQGEVAATEVSNLNASADE